MRTFVLMFVCVALLLAGPAAGLAQGPGLQNGAFDGGLTGWQAFATEHVVAEKGLVDYDQSFFSPTFKMADDPARWLNGPTLQIDATEYTRWNGGIFQVGAAPAGALLQLSFSTGVYAVQDKAGGNISVRVGIDPEGRAGCRDAVWGAPVSVGHLERTTVSSAQVRAGAGGRVTFCLEGTVQYPLYKGALFVDDAQVRGAGGVRLAQGQALSAGPGGAALAVAPTPPPGDPALAGLTAGGQASAETGGAGGWWAVLGLALLAAGMGWSRGGWRGICGNAE